jgi:hypothetical protein
MLTESTKSGGKKPSNQNRNSQGKGRMLDTQFFDDGTLLRMKDNDGDDDAPAGGKYTYTSFLHGCRKRRLKG